MILKGNPKTARALNRRLVLGQLLQNGPISRAAIADAIGLSSAAVTLVTSELIEQGLIVEGKSIPSAAGRRPVPLEIAYTARFSIGLRVSVESVSGIITDLANRVIEEFELPIADNSAESVVAVSAEVTETLLAKADVDRQSLIGIGLIISGQVDAENGICRQMQRFGWHDEPIARMLADLVQTPVWIENDANAFALSQHLFGYGRGARSMVAIALGLGVGAGIIIDGRIHRGAGGAAGEFGHSFEEHGRTCECGRDGCLETYCADAGLLLNWQMLDPTSKGKNVEDLLAAADSENSCAQRVLREAGTRLGQHVAGLVNIIDPEIIVFGGDGVRFGDHLFDAVAKVMQESCYPGVPKYFFHDNVPEWPLGAAALAINHFFNFEAIGGHTPKQKEYLGLGRVA